VGSLARSFATAAHRHVAKRIRARVVGLRQLARVRDWSGAHGVARHQRRQSRPMRLVPDQ